MNINPTKWTWSQWFATLAYLVMARGMFAVQLLYPDSSDIINKLLCKIFASYIPTICILAIIISSLLAQIYVYGFYVDVTLEYIMFKLAIPAGILATTIFLLFIFSMPLNMSFSWKGALIDILLFLVYSVSIYICYNKVEFRLVDMSELEKLKHDLEIHAESQKEGK